MASLGQMQSEGSTDWLYFVVLPATKSVQSKQVVLPASFWNFPMPQSLQAERPSIVGKFPKGTCPKGTPQFHLNFRISLEFTRVSLELFRGRQACKTIAEKIAEQLPFFEGGKESTQTFLYKVFREPFGSWKSAPKIVDVRIKKWVFLRPR